MHRKKYPCYSPLPQVRCRLPPYLFYHTLHLHTHLHIHLPRVTSLLRHRLPPLPPHFFFLSPLTLRVLIEHCALRPPFGRFFLFSFPLNARLPFTTPILNSGDPPFPAINLPKHKESEYRYLHTFLSKLQASSK